MKDIFNVHQRFSIRKYSFGAASVLLGTVFLAQAPVAHAEGTEPTEQETAQSSTPEESASSASTNNSSEGSASTYSAPSEFESSVAAEAPAETTTASKTAEEAPTTETAVNKSTLNSRIAALQAAIRSAHKDTNPGALSLARAVIDSANKVVANEAATQAEVDTQANALAELITTVNEASSQAKAAEADKKAAAAEAAQPAEKTELEKTVSEAVVTNRLANNFVEKEAKEKEVAVDLTDAVKAAVADNEANITASNQVLADKEATTDALKNATQQLQSSIEAVYVSLRKAGKEEFEVALASTTIAGDGEYTVENPSVIDAGDRISNSGTVDDSSHAMSNNTLVIDGVTVANPTGQASSASGATTLAEAVKLTYTAEPTHPAMMPNNSLILYGQNYGNDANGANGRDDYPVTKDQFDKLNAERELWNGQPSASGWSTKTTTTGTGSTYEYLATEIYGYAYEQGEEVAITNFSKRFGLSEEATNAGWKILGVLPTNLPNGLTYDSATDTISGKISSNLENGVYDNRVNVYVTNGSTTVRYFLANYAVGWIGWKDTTAPTTVTTDDITNAGATLNTNIHFNDNAAPATNTASGTSRKTVTTRADGSITVEAPAWRSVAETSVLGVDQINGISYSTTTGNLTGTASTAGIYTVTAQVKDYADATGNEWTQSGQESHESFTVTVRPDVTIGNVVTGATEVPITVSNGATQITVTLPDGTTVEAAKGSDDNWLITGGTSSTATKGTNIGSGTSIKTPVNASSTTVGVDNISAVVAAENVSATLLTNTITLTTAQGEKVVASFNKEAGRWIINSVNGATVTTVDEAEKADGVSEQWVLVKDGNKGRISYRVENSDDTYSIRHLEIVSDLAATNNRGGSTGTNSYRVFEFTQTFDTDGNVTAASSARSDAQTVNTAVVVTYDAATNTWTASDGSTVTATPNVTRYSTTEAAADAWGHGEDGKDYTAIRSPQEMSVQKDGKGESVPVYRDSESWTITTSSGVSGVVNRVSNKARDYASITNTLPTASATDATATLNDEVNLLDPAHVTTADTQDGTPLVSRVTVTAPDGTVTTYEPTAELAVWNQTKAEVATAKDAYTQATSDLKAAVEAKTAADAAATAKNAELATAESALDAAISEYKIAKAMVDDGNLTGDAATAAQARLTAAEAAQTAAQNTVNTLTAELTTLHNNVAAAQETVNTNLATINTTRAALEDKEKELASARAAVATAVTNALNGSDKFKVDQVGKYTVSLSVIDSSSNQVLDGATATGTTTGDDTNSGTVTASDVTANYTITVNPFEITGNNVTSTDIQGATQTGQPTFTFDDTDKSEINQGTKAYTLTSTEAKDADGNTVGTYSIDATTGVVTFVPNKDYTGTPTPAEVTLTVTFGTGDDAVTKSATATYTPTVVPVKPVAEPSETTDVQGSTQTSNITYNADNNTDNNTNTLNFAKGSADVNGTTKSVELDKTSVQFVNSNNKAVDTLTVENQGTYTLVKDDAGNVTGVQFVPVATFTGDATPVTVQIKDVNGTAVTTTYTPHVTPVTAAGENKTSSDIQGAVQHGTPEFKVSDETNIVKGEDGKPAATYALKGADADGKVEVKDGDKVLYTYTINPTTGEVTFTPAKDYTGTPAPATVVATYTLETEDKDDTTTTPITAEATYTPTIVPVTPSAVESSTTGIQGAVQKSPIVLDATDTNVDTLNFNKGTENVNGTDKSVNLDPNSVTLLDAQGNPATSVTVAGQGTYTIVTEEDGTKSVQFTPVASYTGDVTPVTVQIADENGTKVTTTYTPKIVGVTPVADASQTTGKQGQAQTSTIVYDAENNSDGNITTLNFAGGSATVNGTKQTAALDHKSVTLLDASGNAVDTVTVAGQGTYTLVKDGEGNVTGVTFTPEASFTGTATPVNVRVSDVNGNTAQTTYTPTVIPNGTVVVNYVDEDGKVIKTPVTTTDLEDGSNYDTTPNRDEKITGTDGTVYYYKKLHDDSAAAKGKVNGGDTTEVTYVYEKAGSVTVNYVDKDGNVIKKPVTDEDNVKPGTKYDTTDNKPTTITTEEGKTYRLVPNQTKGNETGTVLSGENTQVTYTYEEVKGKVVVETYDSNGKKLTTKEVVKETSTGTTYSTKPEEKITVDGKTYFYKEVKSDSDPETGKVKEGTTTVKYVYEEAGSVKVNYTLADGTVIKTPVTPDAYKDAKAGTDYTTDTETLKPQTITTADGKKYRLVPTATKGNENGKVVSGETAEVTYVYEEVKTRFVDKDGKEIPNYPEVDGEQPSKNIPGYRLVETKKLPNGDTEHVYEQVKTRFVDKEGKEIPNNPEVDGEQPRKDIPGYRFVETKKLPNGDTEHVYEQVKTRFVDKDGNPIPGNPEVDGEQPAKNIPGYRFVETKKLPNGDTEHVYEKVVTPTKKVITSFVDEDGNPLLPSRDGQHGPAVIPGYVLVDTKTDEDGNITHIYAKLKPVTPSTPENPVKPSEKPNVTPTSVKPATAAKELPNTGTENNAGLAALGLAGLLGGLGLASRKKKED